jgi:hypothetical protein
VVYASSSSALATGSALVFDGSKLGIGTSSPASRLDVSYGGFAGSQGAIAMGADVGANTSRTNATRKFGVFSGVNYTNAEENITLIYYDSDGTNNYIVYGGGPSGFNAATIQQWFTAATPTTTGGTEGMRLTSTGLGIGTSSPAYKLHVDSTGGMGVKVAAGGYNWLNLISGDTGNMSVGINDNGGSGAFRFVQYNSGGTFVRSAIDVTDAGNVKLSNSMSVGGATVSTSGSGITFPATQSASSDANTLDDYEEGTWTPIIVGATTAGTGTYSSQNGRYTKVGNMVTATSYVEWSAHTGTGGMRLGGLPFATLSATNNLGGVAVGYNHNIALTANNVLTAYTLANSTECVVDQYPVGGGASTTVPIDTAGGIVFTVSYLTST